MKPTQKTLIILMITGLAGIAVILGIILGIGQIRPYAQTQSYPVENVEHIALTLHAAKVTAVPATEQYRAEVYVNAWLPRPPAFDRVVSVTMTDGTLNITETPFPDEFFGIFPQPYEINITLYLPEAACEQLKEVQP